MLPDQPQTNAPRPLTVIGAVICVAVALAGAPLSWVFTLHWHEPLAVLAFLGISLLLFFIARSLYMRRNWARWLIIAWTAFGTLGVPQLLREFTFSFPSLRSLIQFVLYVVASVLLLCPASRRWFSTSSNVA